MKFKWVNVGSKMIAELLGITERYVHDLVKEGKIPKISHGLYNPVDVIRALRQADKEEIKRLRAPGEALLQIELAQEEQRLIRDVSKVPQRAFRAISPTSAV